MAKQNDVVASGSPSPPANKKAEPSPYKGIRMRKWGKWVAEVREPHKRTRIWLGSYYSPIAAARAYDTAMYYLRGPTAKLNFPELMMVDSKPAQLSAASIRRRATAVGARVDAEKRGARVQSAPTYGLEMCWFVERPDLNKEPEPDSDTEPGGA